MNASIQNAINAVARPDVQAIIQELAKHGLGVCVPHMHSDAEGFAQLPSDIVAVEENLVVSFKARDEVKGAIPVAWRWDNELKAVQLCQCCNVGHCISGHDLSDSDC